MVKKHVLTTWIENNPPVEKWIKRLEKKTGIANARTLYRFIIFVEKKGGLKWIDKKGNEHIGMTPEELLNAQDELQSKGRRERYKILEIVQEWINSEKARFGTKKQRYTIIRSFFLHNRVPLPEDKSFKIKGDEEPVQGNLNIEDLQKIILSSNEAYQAVFLIMFQSGMGGNEFDHFNNNNWKLLKPQLEAEKKIIRIDLPGRKHSENERPYYTFIGKDAINALNRYLRIRGPIKNSEPIFINKNGTPISDGTLQRYFKRHIVRLGIIKYDSPPCPECGSETRKKIVSSAMKFYKKTGSRTQYTCNQCGHMFPSNEEIKKKLRNVRYGISPHEMRDLFRSCWETSPAKGVVAEFFMGHAIDPNNYNKFFKTDPDWVESQYKKAVPWLNIISEDPRKIPIDEVSRLTDKTRDQNSIIAQQQEEIDALKQQLKTKDQENETTKQDISELKRQFNDLKKLVMEKKT